MQLQLTNRTSHATLPAQFEDYINRESAKLGPILESFSQDAVLLRVVVDEASRRGDIVVLLHLSLPKTVLNSQQVGPLQELRSVFDAALHEVRRQLLEYKQHLDRRS